MALTGNHVGIFLGTFLTFMIFFVPVIIPVYAINSVEDGKWDFTISNVITNKINDDILVKIAIDFEGTETEGTADVIFTSTENEQFLKTISNIQQDETRWIEFKNTSQNKDFCQMHSNTIMVTTPNFKNGHIFDEKTIFFVPYQSCPNIELGIENIDTTNHNADQTLTFDEPEIEFFGISNPILEMYKGKIHYAKIFGNIAKSKVYQGHDLMILMTKPDNSKENLRIQVTSEGKFETILRFDFDYSMTGTYTFEPTYMEKYRAEPITLTVSKSFT